MARILIIDDHVEFRSLVANHLSEDAHVVSIAENGIDGIHAFKATPFDLVITDVHMPEADGLEVIKAIRAVDANVPVIAMSGGGRTFPAAVSLSASRAFGATAILYKPFHVSELRDAVREALASR